VRDDLIDLILRRELATRPSVPVLGASLTPGAVSGQKLLRLQGGYLFESG
jgi:hypothetical protein